MDKTCKDFIGSHQFSSYPIGTAIDDLALETDFFYAATAIKQFNSFTPENIFKPEYLHPSPLVFNWTAADNLVHYCEAIGARLHGHTLIWHNQLPAWMSSFEGSTAEWDAMMKTHIQTIVSHFKGKVAAWDVVNEAFNEDGTLRNSIWKEKLGSSYIEKAFLYAAEADPDALLFYNDYNLESNPTKRKSVLNLLQKLKARGVKIDGIGVQMHVSIDYPEPMQIADALQEIASHKLRIHISELDISVNPSGNKIAPTADLLQEQADLLGTIVLNYNQLPEAYQYGITFWGVADHYSWIRSYYNRIDYPLLFDENYKPKPCYCKLIELL